MKIAFILTALLSLFIMACDEGKPLLNINNLSDYPLLNVEYSSINFGVIKSGGDLTKEVNEGTKYIFFSLQTNTSGIVRCKTESVTCSKEKNNEYLITNNTIITVTVTEKTETLKGICNELKVSGQYYSIGDIGPGGGIVFFAQGGRYKEVSKELGTYAYSDAASKASNFSSGGFTNWYLPDRGDIQLIYDNLHAKSIKKFSKSSYWSSTTYGTTYKYLLDFSNGRWNQYGNIYETARTLAIRNFNF